MVIPQFLPPVMLLLDDIEASDAAGNDCADAGGLLFRSLSLIEGNLLSLFIDGRRIGKEAALLKGLLCRVHGKLGEAGHVP